MSEITSLIRLRISAHDAHYAGDLVDGAKMLNLFGDVATELLIRSDGDEGLFVAYDKVEFLAPVHAGDYIEAHGRIVSMGNTSRKMEFEARKVIAVAEYEKIIQQAFREVAGQWYSDWCRRSSRSRQSPHLSAAARCPA